MAAGVEHHTGRAQSGLGDQREGKLPWETHAYTGVGKRFHDQKLITRSAAAQRSHGVKVDFVQRQALPYAFEYALGTVQVSLRIERPRKPEDYRLNLVALGSYRDQLRSLHSGEADGRESAIDLSRLLVLPGVVEEVRSSSQAPQSLQ